MTVVYHTDLADGQILTTDLPISRQHSAQEIIAEWSRYTGNNRTVAANVISIGDLLAIVSLGWDSSEERKFTARELLVVNFGINESIMEKLIDRLDIMQTRMYKSMHIAEGDIDWEVAWYDLIDRWVAIAEEYIGINAVILSSKSFEQTLSEAMILDENPTESEKPQLRDITKDIEDIAKQITEDPDIFNELEDPEKPENPTQTDDQV